MMIGHSKQTLALLLLSRGHQGHLGRRSGRGQTPQWHAMVNWSSPPWRPLEWMDFKFNRKRNQNNLPFRRLIRSLGISRKSR
jgi:hypothetical protein